MTDAIRRIRSPSTPNGETIKVVAVTVGITFSIVAYLGIVYSVFGMTAGILSFIAGVVGFTLIPMPILMGLVPKGMREIVGRLHGWLQVSAFGGGMALVERQDGSFSLEPMWQDGGDWYTNGSGGVLHLDDRNQPARFLGGYFAEVCERGQHIAEYVTEAPEPNRLVPLDVGDTIPGDGREVVTETVAVEQQETPSEAVADGGATRQERLTQVWLEEADYSDGIEWNYNPYPDADGLLVDLKLLANRFKWLNGGHLGLEGIKEGHEEGGPDHSTPSGLIPLILKAMPALIGGLSGFFVAFLPVIL